MMNKLNYCASHDLRDLKNYLQEKVDEYEDLNKENIESLSNEIKILKSFVASLNKVQNTLQAYAYVVNDRIDDLKKINQIVDGDDL